MSRALPTATASGPAEIRRELYTSLSTKLTQYWGVRASHRENLAALVDALNKAKPAATKGVFLKKLSVSSTMGIGVKVDPASLAAPQ